MAIPRGTGIISIVADTRKVVNMFTGYQKTLPKAMRKGIKTLAGIYAMKYLEQLPRAQSMNPANKRGIQPFTGKSFQVLKDQIKNPIKIGDGFGVVVPSHLVALDRMRPHGVQLRRGREITEWAKRKLPSSLENITRIESESKIRVYPHPWVQNANRNARRFIKKHPRKELREAIRRKGR